MPRSPTFKRKNIYKRLDECILWPYWCVHCGLEGNYKDVTDHCHTTCVEFPLECPNRCGLRDIKRKDMEKHCTVCPNQLVKCPNMCPYGNLVPRGFHFRIKRVKRNNIDRHLNEECELRPYKCDHCGQKDIFWAILTHYRHCTEFPLQCPNKCGVRDIKRKDMKDHCSQCPKEVINCPYREIGCKRKFERRELEQHMATTQKEHMEMATKVIKTNKILILLRDIKNWPWPIMFYCIAALFVLVSQKYALLSLWFIVVHIIFLVLIICI